MGILKAGKKVNQGAQRGQLVAKEVTLGLIEVTWRSLKSLGGLRGHLKAQRSLLVA